MKTLNDAILYVNIEARFIQRAIERVHRTNHHHKQNKHNKLYKMVTIKWHLEVRPKNRIKKENDAETK